MPTLTPARRRFPSTDDWAIEIYRRGRWHFYDSGWGNGPAMLRYYRRCLRGISFRLTPAGRAAVTTTEE